MALTGVRIDNFMNIMCFLNAWGYDILIFTTSFQKSNIGWPQQPPTEEVSDISEKLDFFTKRDQYWSFWYQWWSNHQVQEVLWWNGALEAVCANEAAEVNETVEVLRPRKSLQRTPESSRFLNSALFLCFEIKTLW